MAKSPAVKVVRHIGKLQITETRGTGVTHSQLENCPKGSIFIWCTNDTWYPKRLAAKIDRGDIRVERASILDGNDWQKYLGMELPAVITDHALQMNSERFRNLKNLESRIR
jgi:hypothetical protein